MPIGAYRSDGDARSTGTPGQGSRTLFQEIVRAGDAMGRLVRDHLGLAKIEAGEEARKASLALGVGLVALPFGLAALIMLNVALALGLSSWVGGAWAFLITGGIDILIATGLGVFAGAKLKGQRRLEVLEAELRKNRSMIRSLEAQLRAGPRRRPAQAPQRVEPAAVAHPPRDPRGEPVSSPVPPT